MTTKNDITGNFIKSKWTSEKYRKGFDRIVWQTNENKGLKKLKKKKGLKENPYK